MRREITIQGASFSGTSDLTIVAPIKKGFVPSIDAVTYKTRVKRVLKTLHLGRQTAHEYEFARVLSDAVERVGRIHSIRIAILEPEDKVMLAVTFDGSWESYIRVIWQKVSRSLDLIFCNTEDYVTGWDHSFEEWCVWLRKSQAEAPFLYSPPGLSYQDTVYLRMFERRLRHDGTADLAATRIRIPTAENISDQMCEDGTDPSHMGLNEPLDIKATGRPAFTQGMRSLAGLFRLVDIHLPGTQDGAILHRGASELLREFLPMVTTAEGRARYQEAIAFAELRFDDALDWLRDTPATARQVPPLPAQPPTDGFADVQGGIVESFAGVSDGALLLLAFDAPQDLAAFLERAAPTRATDTLAEGGVAVNLALTLEGMRLAGLSDAEVAALPQEFVQGMERRAGMLGDVRVNHPRRWRRPPLNWQQGAQAADVAEESPCARVDLGSVHLALQLRLCNSRLATAAARERLLAEYAARVKGLAAPPRPLSIQWMQRLTDGHGQTREHFGFLDSQSQPVLQASKSGAKFPNHIHLGEILLGYDNAADPAPAPAMSPELAAHMDAQACRLRNETHELLRNGSFLVIRKLRQDVGALEQALQVAARETAADPSAADALEAQRQLLLGKMMGRWPIGHPKAGQALANATPGNDNDFSFDRDAQGARCPLHAHIRRANPRDNSEPEPPGARPARLIRRGMSYGPLHAPNADPAAHAASLGQERGLVFMAYNASIGEQFEVVQRWLSGGNSSGSYSGQSDPFVGVAEAGRKRCLRFETEGETLRMHLDGSERMHDEPRPIVRLEWGMYLFAPSLSSLGTLAQRARQRSQAFAKSWSEDLGELEIGRLRQLAVTHGERAAFDAWKAAIEDPSSAMEFSAASIWAAIRKNHGGVLDTPFGVLVASRTLVDQVLQDRPRNLTATGYLPRMQRSFGPLYLGMDAGQIDGAYELESADVNAAIMDLVASPTDFSAAVAEAAKQTRCALTRLKCIAAEHAMKERQVRWETTFEARELIDEVLAHFCETWFGLSEAGGHLQRSGMRWNWKPGEPPCYPGHFMAPSRYTFQPHPGPEVERIGAEHGLALRVAVTNYLAASGKALSAPVARAALDCEAARKDLTYPARTLAGVLMGFLPTTDGNMRRVLNEWLNEGTLWSLRARHASTAPDDVDGQQALAAQLRRKFVEAMQLRAAPELLWRTAASSHVIGKPGVHQVRVRPGRIVVASLISAMQQCLEQGDPSLAFAFGGQRARGAPHPTHACPGYGPAEAVMLGFFQGLVSSELALRPGPAALSMSMEGYIQLPQATPAGMPAHTETGAAPEGLKARRVPLLTIGDSWLHAFIVGPIEVTPSLSTELKDLGYDTGNNFCKPGRTLREMAQPSALRQLRIHLANLQGEPDAPQAVLLGGGGNDLVDPPGQPSATRLYGMLVKGASTAETALDEGATAAFIDGELKDCYRRILSVITATATLPILIHGYDHPIPDGRASSLGPGPWLEPVFKARGMAMPFSADVMKILINRLNRMVHAVAQEFPGRVHALDLTGELARQADFAGNPRTYWANELHATDTGFDILAKVVQTRLQSLGV